MRKSFFLRLVLLNTFKKKLRAFLVIGGIAITSSAMIVLFGVSEGLHSLVTNEISTSSNRDVITVDQRNLQQIKLNQDKVSEIKSISGIGQVESSVGLVGNLIYRDVDLSIPVYGVSKEFFGVSPAAFRQGEGTALEGTNVVVSKKVLEAFGLDETEAMGKPIVVTVTIAQDYSSAQVEESVTTKEETFTISGVIDKGELPVAYLPLEVLQSKGVDSVSQVKVRVTVPDKVPVVREAVEQMGFQTTSIQDTVDQINKLFTVIQKTLVIFAIIVFGITVSGTFTIISLTLMEEMKQIGFLRISGLRNQDVKILFVVQSILLTTLGAMFGVLGGILGGGLLNEFAQAAASDEVFTGDIVLFSVPATQIMLVLILSVAIGWLVGIFPAKRAVSIPPLEEMKL